MPHVFPYLVLSLLLLTALPAAGQDETPPLVSHTTPADGAADVPVDVAVLYVHFDEQMDRDTYDGNIYLTVGTDPGGAQVALANTYQGGTYCGLAPASELVFATTYGLHVGMGVADLAGNNLAAPYAAVFTTSDTGSGDQEPPVVVLTDPLTGAVGVPVDLAAVTVVFNEPMDAGTLAAAVHLRVGLAADGPPVATSGQIVAADSCTLQLAEPLAAGTVHSLHVGTGATDLAGNALAVPFGSSFWTEPPAEDLDPPFVTSTDPPDGATGILQTVASVRIDFNEFMDIDSFAGNITVTGPGAGIAGETVGVSHVTVHLSGALAASTLYTIEVGTGVTDFAGNPLAAPHSVSFTTSSQVPAETTSWGGLRSRFR